MTRDEDAFYRVLTDMARSLHGIEEMLKKLGQSNMKANDQMMKESRGRMADRRRNGQQRVIAETNQTPYPGGHLYKNGQKNTIPDDRKDPDKVVEGILHS